MQILYEIIGAGVLLALVYVGVTQVVAVVQSIKSKGDKQ